MAVLMVPTSDIVANRYRNIKHYKISEEKIEKLIQSYENSGFWDGSIQARQCPDRPGKYEICFGHHRVEAAKRQKIGALGLVVGKRSNEDMLRMMHDENAEVFKHDALIAVHDIGAVIEAYGRGEIELPPIDPKDRSTIFALPSGNAKYNLASIATFLRWVKPSNGSATSACQRAFEAYHEHAGTEVARELPLDKRSEVAVRSVVTAARVARTEAHKAGKNEAEQDRLARKAAQQQADAVKKESGFKERQKARRTGYSVVHGKPPLPDLALAVKQLLRTVKTRNKQDDETYARFNEALKYAGDLPSVDVENTAAALVRAAEIMEKRAQSFRSMSESWIKRANIKNVTVAKRRVAGMLEESA